MTIESPRCEAACSSLKFFGVRECRLPAKETRLIKKADGPTFRYYAWLCGVHCREIDAGKTIEIAATDCNGEIEAIEYKGDAQ